MNRTVLAGVAILAAVILWSVNYESTANAGAGCHGEPAPVAAGCAGSVEVVACCGPTRGQMRRAHRRVLRAERRALRRARHCCGVVVRVGCSGV